MEIEATSADRNLLLELKGELDHHGARDALRELELAIDAALPKKLVLDLGGVTFMDSSGIALILRAQQRMGLLDIDWDAVIRQNVKPQFAELNVRAFAQGVSLVQPQPVV